MIVFWIMTGLAAALAALLVLTGARRGADPAAGAETRAGSREIEELDRLKARGLLDEAAYAGARAEAGRRLLAVSATTTPVAGARDRFWVLGGIGVTVAAALGLYVFTGSPGLPDQAADAHEGADVFLRWGRIHDDAAVALHGVHPQVAAKAGIGRCDAQTFGQESLRCGDACDPVLEQSLPHRVCPADFRNRDRRGDWG